MSIPGSLLFFGIGTALFVFFKLQPETMNPTLNNTDAIYPWYIVTQLPFGIAGLLIAALFAAAMSSLDSSINSVATSFTTDFYRRFKPNAGEHTYLQIARWATFIIGTTGTIFALVMTGWDIKSLWDTLNSLVGLFAGGLAGLFLLGILTERTNGTGAVIGIVTSGIIQYLVKEYTSIHLTLYCFTGLTACFVVGYLASIVVPVKGKSTEGLTIYTLKKSKEN